MGTFHHVVFDEADDFTPRSRCIPLEWLDDRIRLTERESNAFAQVGALPFGFTQRGNSPTVPLRPGRWVRWLQNARWSSATGHGDWHYTAETVNIALGSVESAVFAGDPGKAIDERVALR